MNLTLEKDVALRILDIQNNLDKIDSERKKLMDELYSLIGYKRDYSNIKSAKKSFSRESMKKLLFK